MPTTTFDPGLPALQQPDWGSPDRLEAVCRQLSGLPALVDPSDLRTLRAQLAEVAVGEACLVQAGDCSEDPAECNAGDVARKVGLIEVLAGIMKMRTHSPVVRVGRIAGQFGKPRSKPTQLHDGVELPAYRGHMVNSVEPDAELRRPDPNRLLTGYRAAAEAMHNLGWLGERDGSLPCPTVWTSHDALLLAYEAPMLRPDGAGGRFLGSTHWPWLGERTRNLDGAHVAMLAEISNPVACKIGPSTTEDEVLALCARLDPRREPGRLTLIARMGADLVAQRLPPLVRAVQAAGYPVIWLTDPMHGNTFTTPDGLKTRFVADVVREVELCQDVVRASGGVMGGLHLESTPDEVTECVLDHSRIEHVADKYTSHCDPRLNPDQAIAVLSAWHGQAAR